MTRSLCFALAALVISHASTTGAQAPEETREPGGPLTAILQTEVPEPALADFGAALQRVLRAELRSLEVVDIAGTPALGLEDIRLMVGCLSDTPECFEAFAAQLEVEALLLPSLARAGDAYVVSLVFFDGAEVHEVTRQASEEQVEENLVGGLGGMLRELFGLPPEEAAGPVVTDLDAGGATGTVTGTASTGATSSGADGEAPPRRESERAWVPGVVTLAAGAAVLGAGLGVGLAAQASEDDWLATSPGTREEVQEALGLRDEAQRRATTANTLFVVGGLTLATGAALLFLLLGDDDETRATLAPAVGPRGFGLQLRGSL